MFAYKKHNPYVMHARYEPDELVHKIEQTIAYFSASQALIEQIKANWEKYKDEEVPRASKGWFKKLIDDIKDKVESVDETLAFFHAHADKYYEKIAEIREIEQVVMANIEHQKAIIAGTEQPPLKYVPDEEEKEDLEAVLEKEKFVEEEEEKIVEEEKKEAVEEITDLTELAMINNSSVRSVQQIMQD